MKKINFGFAVLGLITALAAGCGGFEGDSPETTIQSEPLACMPGQCPIRPSTTCCGYSARYPTTPSISVAQWCAMQSGRGCTCPTSCR
jgi:hypothetical protein